MKAMQAAAVGNQLPILLISFRYAITTPIPSWESVTNPLDKLFTHAEDTEAGLGISYQSS